MHEYVCFNREIMRAQDASLTAASSAALYGKSVFTTVAIFDKKPFLWEKHWRRLTDHAEKLKIDVSDFSERSVENSLFALAEKNNCVRGRARITFFDEQASAVWHYKSEKRASFLITTADRREIKDARLTISPFPVNSASPLAGIKSGNYLENIFAFDESRGRFFDEAVRLNERGRIVSACLANIFWSKDERLYTPALSTGCLAGTTRAHLTEKFDVAEIAAPPEILDAADAIFLTSAGIGVIQVAEYKNRKFTAGFEDVTKLIKK